MFANLDLGAFFFLFIDVEMRRTRVRLDTASRIAKALDCEVTDLFTCDEVIG